MPTGKDIGRPLASKTRTFVVYPDKFRVDAKVGNAEVLQVFNSGVAWVRDPTGVHDAPPPMRDDFASSVRRDTIPMLIAASEGRLSVKLLPEEGRDGRVMRVIEVTGAQFSPVRLFIDQQGLIARQAYSTAGPDGRPVAVEGQVGVAHGRTRYLLPDGTIQREFDNIFVLHFDGAGRCTRFTEWYMQPRARVPA